MAILVSAQQISKAYGARALFTNISFSIETGMHIGLIGPNGAGKSTLLKILAKEITPDDGTLSFQRGLRVGMLNQAPQFQNDSTVHSTVMEGVHDEHDWEETAR